MSNKEVRYPRRFKRVDGTMMLGGYVEYQNSKAFGKWIDATGLHQTIYDSSCVAIDDAEEFVRRGDWIETFDHHEPKPRIMPSELPKESEAAIVIDGLNETIRDLRAENERLRNEIPHDYGILKTTIACLTEDVDRITKENDRLRTIDASKESQIGALHQRDRNTVDHLNDMIRRNDELSKRNETLQALLAEERERHAKAIADAKEMEDGLRDSIGGRNGWREINDKLAAKISDVEAERDNFHHLLKAENAHCLRFQSDLNRERGRADAAIERCKELAGKLCDVTLARDELAAKLESTTTQFVSMTMARDQAWQECAEVAKILEPHLKDASIYPTAKAVELAIRELAAKVQELQSIVAMGAFAAADSEPNEPNCKKCLNCEKVTADRDTIYRELLSLRDEKKSRDAKIASLHDEAEQLRVQLAGCLTAADGYFGDNEAKQGDYGWSVAYDHVATIRKKYEVFRNALRNEIQAAWQRLDYSTADRIAELIGDPKPSDHEKADATPETSAEWPEVWERNGPAGKFRVTFNGPNEAVKSQSDESGDWKETFTTWRRYEMPGIYTLVSKGGKAVT